MNGYPTIDLPTVVSADGACAPAYIDLFGGAEKADPEDRNLVAAWSQNLTGPVLDAGCGPGRWAAFLPSRGIDVEGIDATPEFVAHAARTHPHIRFRLGDLRAIGIAERSLGGVLAWFSLIHTDPKEVPMVLRMFARALQPGGSLLVGFVGGERLEPFIHRVVTGWTWPMSAMVDAIESVGVDVISTEQHQASNGRLNAAILARSATDLDEPVRAFDRVVRQGEPP